MCTISHTIMSRFFRYKDESVTSTQDYTIFMDLFGTISMKHGLSLKRQ